MRTNSMRAAVAALTMALAGAAQGSTYYLTRMDVKTAGQLDPAIVVRAHTEPAAFVALSNTSDRAVRCHMDFSTGPVPAGSSEHTVAPHGNWIARSPVAGPAGVIDVLVGCS